MSSRTVAIIQARSGGARLPRKVLRKFGSHAVIEHVVRRVQAAGLDVIVAMPLGDANAELGDAVDSLGVRLWAANIPEADVLTRFAGAALMAQADVVVRITADCPLIDPAIIAELVRLQRHTGAEYVSNVVSAPRVDGLDCEVFTRSMLELADELADQPGDREHVTPWIRRNAESVWHLERRLPLPSDRQLRWTLDTVSDWAWLQSLASALPCTPPHPTLRELVEYLQEHPEMMRFADQEPERSAA